MDDEMDDGVDEDEDEHVDERLRAALDADDAPGLLAVLARSVLWLITLPGGDGWDAGPVAGQPTAVAFTSPAALADAGLMDAPSRAVSMIELAATWPDRRWQLAVNPGSPSHLLIDAATLQDVAALAARPATLREERLGRALRSGDVDGYLAVLMKDDVVVPITHPAVPGDEVPWRRVPWMEGGDAVIVFTSARRLREASGNLTGQRMPFAEVVRHWPTGTTLVVDPGLRHGRTIDPPVMDQLKAQIRASSQDPA